MSYTNTIEEVRSELEEIASSQVEAGLTHDSVMAVVRGVMESLPMHSANGGRTLTSVSGLPEQTVLDIIAGFGTYRSHSNKTLPKFATEHADEVEKSGALPGFVADHVRARNGEKGVVPVPAGVARRGKQRRDVSKAYAAIRIGGADLEHNVALWLSRVNPQITTQPLTFSEVAYVAFVARHGFITDLVELCKSETLNRNAAERAIDQANCTSRARLLANAMDLLETARSDAFSAVALLAEADTSDLEALRQAAVKARWVHEGSMRDIGRAIEYAVSNSGRVRDLAAKLRAFQATVVAQSVTYAPVHIGQLSEAQVLRICQISGLNTEDLGPVKDQIRRGLDTLGLSSERNRLIPEALACYQAGSFDAFWRSAAKLASSDPEWRVDIDEALVEV